MQADSAVPEVEVFWRPGCPFCNSLRRDLNRRHVPAVWRNIWEDNEARAIVRDANRGNETVPTVRVAGRTLSNPSGRHVAELAGVPEPERTSWTARLFRR